MKSVLISIKPQWCEKIVSGEKTIEVRKSAPKKTPFKCYIYCCKSKPYLYRVDDDDNFELARTLRAKVDGYVKDYNEQNGKVIGEFICDKSYLIENQGNRFFVAGELQRVTNEIARQSCLYYDDMVGYLGDKDGYGWHISDLKIYDKPEPIMQFYKPCPIKIKNCPVCELYSTYTGCCMNNIDHPPQSWCYVEEI